MTAPVADGAEGPDRAGIDPAEAPVRPLTGVRRVVVLAAGFACVGLGTLGVVVPGLPTTGFFVAAAWCFARSSERFERWVLGLPGVGPMVRDHRAGLGMPRKAKGMAIGTMVGVATLSIVLAVEHSLVRVVIAAAVAVGAWYIAFRVPTRERVLAERSLTA